MAVMCIDLEIISTHTPLARRDFLGNIRHFLYKISTHTPLARRDVADPHRFSDRFYFYSHASCEA